MDHTHEPARKNSLNAPREDIMAQTENPVCYHQSCPVCGRNLRIRVLLLGRLVYCQHCGGGFTATDSCTGNLATKVEARPQATLVDELLERAAVVLSQSGE